MRDDKLAQQMFYGGCAFLPWMWVVNVMYFRKAVYGPIPLVDYFPGGDRRQTALDRFADGSAYDNDDEDGPIENMPQVGGGSASDDTDAETDFDDDDGGGEGSGDDDEARVGARGVQRGVEKWVKRSTMSATLVVGLFATWVAVFQVYKDSFGPNWFVMSEDEGLRTGW